MKAFLIFLNICLAGGIFWSLLKQAETPQVNEDEYFFRASEKEKKKTPAKTETVSRKKEPVPETRSAEVSVRRVVEGNIFDPARCPGARIPGRRNSNTGLDMTLVGTFVIGEQSGAIILQKRRQNTNFPFPWMQQGGPPIAMPAFQNNGQQGGGFMNGGAQTSGAGNTAQNQNNGQQGGGFARARFGSGEMFARWRQMQNRQQNGGNNEEAAVVYQQYVRVGETLANGYKLTAVTRTGATLMKNSEKLELELVEASRNAGAERSRNTNTNPFGTQGRGMMFPWMMQGMMMNGMGGMGGTRGGFPFNNNGFMQQNGGGNQQQNGGGTGRNGSRGSWQGRSRSQ
ncbi:MAG: hypothetical protein J5944_02615 [Lentisphaeria bacterium]|nr:hypothetical protein [Lentisphaeria bacterium]